MSTQSNELPIFTSPCYQCTWFQPRIVDGDLLLCDHWWMDSSFSCLEKRFPFNTYEVEDILINPRYLKVRFKGVKDVREMELNGWRREGEWWVCTGS